jgi:hypothetical protein
MNIKSYISRFNAYSVSKVVLFWTCAACVVATAIVGFNWGGWVTQGTAAKMVAKSAESARAEMAADLCVDRFGRGIDAGEQLAKLKSSDTWKRASMVEEGGWVTLPGTDKPVLGAAALCAEKLTSAPLPKQASS